MKIKITFFALMILASISTNASNYFWVGGSGNWSDFATHWASTSGGSTFFTQVPQSTDNVFFDSHSFASTGQTVTIEQPFAQCADMIWSGVVNHPTFYGDYTSTLKIYGSLILTNGMTFNFNGPVSFEATTTGQTITTAGNTINTSLTFNGTGGGWTLSDELTTTWMYLNNGTFTTNNQTINAFAFTSPTSYTRTLNLGSSTFNLSFYGPVWNINPAGMTLNAGTSTIKGISTYGGAQDFYGGGLTYNNIFFTGTQPAKINGNSVIHNVSFAADGYIQCNCTFNDVFFATDAFMNGNSTYNNVTLSKNGEFISSNTFNNLILTPDYSYTLKAGETQEINTSLTANGACGALIDIRSNTAGSQAFITKTAGVVTLSNISLKDISVNGGATFTANNAHDLGNNTGWTINALPSRNLFWVGNGGNWNNGNHWSTISGGAPAGCSPTPADNVFFDANSFSLAGQTVTINTQTASANNIMWTGVAKTPTFYGDYTSNLKVYGSLTLATGMTFNFNGPVSFEATTTGQTITSAGNTINTSVAFNGTGGGWTLSDELTASWMYLNKGTLNTNNQTVNVFAFTSSNSSTRALNMGSSTFNLSFYGTVWNINPAGMNLNAGTSTIKGNSIYGGGQDFYGGGLTYNNIFFTGTQPGKINSNNVIHNVSFAADGYIQGDCTFNDVFFAANAFMNANSTYNNVTISKDGEILSSNTFNNLILTPDHTYTLAAGETQTINSSLTATGNCGALIDIKSNIAGSQATITKATGNVSLSHITIKDINVNGGATFIANNAQNFGNNTGWTINSIPSKNLFWIGNGGNWNDGNHWSTTSGGAPIGCSPTPMDNVFFDANSFSLVGQTVTINVPTAYANNMVWTGVTNNPTFYGDYVNTLKIYGSLTLATGMTFNFIGSLLFEATTDGQTITSAGKTINTSITFNGIGGGWILQDELKCNYWIYLNNGTFTSNNKTVNAYAFSSITNSTRILNMGSSTFNLSFNGPIWNINPVGMTINAGTSLINGAGLIGGQQDFFGGGFTYNNISFTGAPLGKIIDYNIIHDVSFGADGYILGGTFHDIFFAANATMYNNNSCNNVTISKNGDILGSNSFNNLILSPGYTYTLTAGETQTIIEGGNICAQGTGALPIRIQSSNDGANTTISKASGTICWDYIRLSDINATGGATFNAGLAPVHSQDMGGNTGVSFTGGCTISGCTPCVSPYVTAQPANSNICAGNNAIFTTTANGTGLTYQWQVSLNTGFINISNIAPYSGATTNTLSITAVPNALNGYKYRCLVSGGCGSVVISNLGILTVNALPSASSSVNSSIVTIFATGGTAPYSGTGSFTTSVAGTYSFTIMDTKGCSASTTAIVTTLADNIAPIAICKNASVTLMNGTAVITPNNINNGSYDNVAIASITVTPNIFTCANIGANTVTLTVKDNSGNVATCQSTIIVVGSIPTVSISQNGLPDFWQGAAIVLNANASPGVNYLWNTGETTSSKNIYASGTNAVTVTNNNGCHATVSYTTNYSAPDLLSSYTVIAREKAKFGNFSSVQSGGVGVTKTDGEIEVENNSNITGSSTFAKANNISLNSSGIVTNKFYAPALLTLPAFKTNPFCENSSANDNHNHGENDNENEDEDENEDNHSSDYSDNNNISGSCDHSNNNVSVANNATVNLTNSIYSKITIGSNTKVTFTQPIVYIKSLSTGSNAKIEFSGCTEIRVCGEIVFGEYTVFNVAEKGVVIYCDEKVQVKKGSNFTGSIYSKDEIETNGTSSTRIIMKGMFIGKEVESKYTTWNWNNAANTCFSTKSTIISNHDNMQEITNNLSVTVYPNPSVDNFNLIISSENASPSVAKIFDITGRLVFANDKVETNSSIILGSEFKKGIYLLTISQGNVSKTVRIVKTE